MNPTYVRTVRSKNKVGPLAPHPPLEHVGISPRGSQVSRRLHNVEKLLFFLFRRMILLSSARFQRAYRFERRDGHLLELE